MNDNDDNRPASTPSEGMVSLDQIQLHPEFGDPMILLNMRHWLERAVIAQGAKVEGAGFGMGEADIDLLLEGHGFNIRIKPIVKGGEGQKP